VQVRVSLTGNPAEVLYLASNERFDAVVLDNWMPDITGLELCQRIRGFDQSTRILFCSGAVTETDMEAPLQAGAQGYIGKPFDPDDLIKNTSYRHQGFQMLNFHRLLTNRDGPRYSRSGSRCDWPNL